jgi:hypothetical protein
LFVSHHGAAELFVLDTGAGEFHRWDSWPISDPAVAGGFYFNLFRDAADAYAHSLFVASSRYGAAGDFNMRLRLFRWAGVGAILRLKN